MNWEFLGNQNDWGADAVGEAAGVPGGGAEQLPGSRSPLSNEPGSLLGEIHWKNSKTERIQKKCFRTLKSTYLRAQTDVG